MFFYCCEPDISYRYHNTMGEFDCEYIWWSMVNVAVILVGHISNKLMIFGPGVCLRALLWHYMPL